MVNFWSRLGRTSDFDGVNVERIIQSYSSKALVKIEHALSLNMDILVSLIHREDALFKGFNKWNKHCATQCDRLFRDINVYKWTTTVVFGMIFAPLYKWIKTLC